MDVATGCGFKEVYRFPLLLIPTPLVSVLFYSSIPTFCSFKKMFFVLYIIESVNSISRDEPDSSVMQYITNAGISRASYTITHFKHHCCVLQLISNRISV